MKKLLPLIILMNICMTAFAQNFQWATSFGSGDYDSGNSILTDQSGNVYTTGYFTGTVDFNPGTAPADTFFLTGTNAGNQTFFLSKLDASGNFIWAKAFENMPSGGTLNYSKGESIASDASGNLYITGEYGGTGDFNMGAAASDTFALNATINNAGIFVLKTDTAGNFIWAKSFETNNFAYCESSGRTVTVDAAGAVYLTGDFSGDGDFNPGLAPADTFYLSSIGNRDAFILKLDDQGNFVWARNFGGQFTYTRAISIAVDNAGNVFTAGNYTLTVDFDPSPAPSDTFYLSDLLGNNNAFISKLDPSGNFVWAKKIASGSDPSYVNDMIKDSIGQIYTTGNFYGLLDFNPGPLASETFYLSSTYYNTYITKLDPDGNFIWAKNIEGSGYTDGFSLAVDPYGNVYNMGELDGSSDLNPGLAPADTFGVVAYGIEDLYLLKLDSLGNFKWAGHIGNSAAGSLLSYTEGKSLWVENSGKILFTGDFYETVDFNPSTAPGDTLNLTANSTLFTDGFILKLCTAPESSGSITGVSPVCVGQSGVYSISPIAFATDYTWSVPPGAVINSGQNTTSLTVTFGATSGVVTVIPSNDCGSGTAITTVVTVTPLPVISVQPANQTDTLGNDVQFAVSTPNLTAIFQWQEDAGAGFITLSNGGQYAGVTTNTLTVSNITLSQNNYAYRCALLDLNCIATSNAGVLTVLDNTGLEELTEKGFRIYPNPSTDFITIQSMAEHADCDFSISDLTGRIILAGKMKNKETTIDISSFAPGIYFAEISEGNKTRIKIVKE